MEIEILLKRGVVAALKELYETDLDIESISLNETIKDYAGDVTVVVFPLTRMSKQAPEQTGLAIGAVLKRDLDIVVDFNVVKGFLNLEISNSYWLGFIANQNQNMDFGKGSNGGKVVLEYCGPNTNKPLHLGHIRNMLLGYSTANLLEFAGNKVHKVNIYNDRGIVICKSMLAWQKFGNGATPESTNTKGDHFVGKFYVEFDRQNKKQIEISIAAGKSKEEAEKLTPLLKEAQEMLLKWEQGDKEVVALWETMNAWCYAGFEETFSALGVDFEKHYKESDYYLRGKELVEEGLEANQFYKKEDGSVWVDLEDKGLDQKLLLRGDGTSVYITQDMGIAEARYEDYKFDESIYVVASEQDYHFKVLQLVLEKMDKVYAQGIYHLSYGLVNLPNGRMKSREGTVVDADDLMEEMIKTAALHTKELGKVDDFTDAEAAILYKKLAMGALKYFILKVSPKKSMIFNPEESIDFQGNTGPFIQFNYVRIQSLLRKQAIGIIAFNQINLTAEEKDLIKEIHKFPQMISLAAKNYDISEVTSFVYNLAKMYSKFYANTAILSDTDDNTKFFRLQLSKWTGELLKTAFEILGIQMPDRM
jgi:arginyl-tRNA synthetase